MIPEVDWTNHNQQNPGLLATIENRPAKGGSDAHLAFQDLAEPEFDVSAESHDDVRILYGRIVEWMGAANSNSTTWQAFHLTVVEDVDPDVAAQRLGISRNAVYLARSRVLRRLRIEFGA